MDQDNVSRHRLGEKEIILVGTAHISRESVELVERIIDEEKPDTVCVELCRARYQAMTQQDLWQETDIIKIIRQKQTSLLIAQWLMASFQNRIAERLRIRPGEDMLAAIRKAEEIGARLVLADREIRVTLTRTWRGLSFWGKIRLIQELLASLLFSPEVGEEEIEALKKQDVLETAIADMKDKFPSIKETIIDERDRWLASCIGEAEGEKIVAVIGAGHRAGIAENLGTALKRETINRIPPPAVWSRLLGWTIPLIILTLILAGFIYSGNKAGLGMLVSWVAITAAFSGLGALVMLAHPATIIASALAAPLTTLHPLLAAGWVAGLTEASLRKPRVKDFISLKQDILSFHGFFRNKITRILVLIALVNMTTSIGTFVAIPVMMRHF